MVMNDERKEEEKEKERPKKTVMKRKDEERSEAVNTLMIASYREKYLEQSLDAIRQIIEQEEPEKIIVLKIIEEKAPSELVEANIGLEEKDDFLQSVREKKRREVDDYSEDIVDLIEEFNIPSEVHLRKGKDVAQEIIEEFKNMEADHVIIHGPKKGALEKVVEGSISENVKKILDTKKVTLLD
ncbi:MAG: universal stress protein [Candidatus Thermoplasmatota archaeon]|nr:universal stress protein [Candidatus Thermoplasmatota archaeon]